METILKRVQSAIQSYFVSKLFSYITGVCVFCMQFAGHTKIICSYVKSNSVRFVADDDTTSAVSPTRKGAHEKTYGM